jgi:hypothetical protein
MATLMSAQGILEITDRATLLRALKIKVKLHSLQDWLEVSFQCLHFGISCQDCFCLHVPHAVLFPFQSDDIGAKYLSDKIIDLLSLQALNEALS